MWCWWICCCFDTLVVCSVCPQGRLRQLEEDLGEERCSGDRMMERLDKTKAQAGLLPLTGSFFLVYSFILGWRAYLTSPSCFGFEHPALHLFPL